MSAVPGNFSKTYLKPHHTEKTPLYPDLTTRIVPGAFPFSAATSVAITLQKARKSRTEVDAFRSEAISLASSGKTTELFVLLRRVVRIEANVGLPSPKPVLTPKSAGQVTSHRTKATPVKNKVSTSLPFPSSK
jgi:hypothetical protein